MRSESVAGATPLAAVLRRTRHDPLRELIDEPGRFDRLDERHRREKSLLRMPPSHQGLRTPDLLALDFHLRLEENLELPRANALRDLFRGESLRGKRRTVGLRRGKARGDHAAQLLRVERLLDRAQQAHAIRARHRLDRRDQASLQAAHEDQRRRMLQSREMAYELHAVHFRHVQVAHDDVDGRVGRLEDLERRHAVAGREHGLRAELVQQVAHEPALESLVLDDEKAKPGDFQ